MVSSIPYEFVLDYLPVSITVKKMFGMHYIYWGKKIMLILRKRDNEPEMNGIWVNTTRKHHQSLKDQIAELEPFITEGDERPSNWMLIPDKINGLEEAAIKVCEMISHGDRRIGKVTEKAPL